MHDHWKAERNVTTRLLASLCLNAAIALAEIIAGVFSGSVALIADATHNMGDVFALASHTSFPADHDLGPPGRGHDFLDASEMSFQHFLLATKEVNGLSSADKGEAEVKEGSHERVLGDVMLHHEKVPPRPQDANDVLQCPVLRVALELVEGVRTGDRVESAVREGKAPCVGFHQTDVGQALGLFLGYFQHSVGKICTNDLAIRADLGLQVCEKRTGTGAEVENPAAVLYGNPID